MSGKFRRIAVLGATSLGTWAITPVAAQADDPVASPTPHVAKAGSATPSEGPDGVRGQPRVEQPQR